MWRRRDKGLTALEYPLQSIRGPRKPAARCIGGPRRFARPPPRGVVMTTIVVFSHLRWDFVFQRPQHLLSRLAQHYPILFVEEPEYDDGAPFMERSNPAPNVT